MGYAERQLHTARFIDIEEVHKNALSGLRTEINGVGALGHGAEFCGKHQVELAHVGPVAGAGDGAHNAQFLDEGLESGQVVGIHQGSETLRDVVNLLLILQHTAVGLAEHLLVEVFETLAGLLNLLVDFLLDFGDMVLDEHIGAVALLGVLVVNQRVIESVHVAGSLPNGRVHKDAAVQTDDVLVVLHHRFPPILLDVVFQFNAILAVVINGAQAVVNFTGRENEAVLFGVGDNLFEAFFVVSHFYSKVKDIINILDFKELIVVAWISGSGTRRFRIPKAIFNSAANLK